MARIYGSVFYVLPLFFPAFQTFDRSVLWNYPKVCYYTIGVTRPFFRLFGNSVVHALPVGGWKWGGGKGGCTHYVPFFFKKWN